MTIAIFPGTFDPVSMGHVDIMRRAVHLFERVIVAVYQSTDGETLFEVDERQALIREAITDLPSVEVETFHGLVVDYAHLRGAHVMIRGLRLNTDFEYEFEMALMNRKLAPDIDVVCLITSQEYLYVRSSLIKEVAKFGGDVTGLVPPGVVTALQQRLGKWPYRYTV
jgi:pantetheine-phosphate adenylyltransferase